MSSGSSASSNSSFPTTASNRFQEGIFVGNGDCIQREVTRTHAEVRTFLGHRALEICVHMNASASSDRHASEAAREEACRTRRAVVAAQEEEIEYIHRASIASEIAKEAERAAVEVIDDAVVRVSLATTSAEKIIRESMSGEFLAFQHAKAIEIIDISSNDEI